MRCATSAAQPATGRGYWAYRKVPGGGLRCSGATQPAAVVGYDEESETYTVLHPDGRRSYFVGEEMIEKRR